MLNSDQKEAADATADERATCTTEDRPSRGTGKVREQNVGRFIWPSNRGGSHREFGNSTQRVRTSLGRRAVRIRDDKQSDPICFA